MPISWLYRRVLVVNGLVCISAVDSSVVLENCGADAGKLGSPHTPYPRCSDDCAEFAVYGRYDTWQMSLLGGFGRPSGAPRWRRWWCPGGSQPFRVPARSWVLTKYPGTCSPPHPSDHACSVGADAIITFGHVVERMESLSNSRWRSHVPLFVGVETGRLTAPI